MSKKKRLTIRADAQVFRFWNDTQNLTMIIEDKESVEPELPNTPTNIKLEVWQGQ